MVFYRERFKKLRELKGMTMADIAALCDVSKQCIEQWENGKSQPRTPKIPVLARILSCEISDICDLADPLSGDSFIAMDERLSFIVENWNNLTEIQQAEIFGFVKGALYQKNNQKRKKEHYEKQKIF